MRTHHLHKFKNIVCEADGIRFDSKLERNRYFELKALKKAGKVIFFLRQVPFHLPGQTKYLCDFLVFWSDGEVTIEDTKGYLTDVFKIKKRQVEELYPIKITLIKAK